ncbi:WD repeat-containing 63 [Brachionus plicatilis]|uniref:WD repeat-containing 63 n=1 Tax=Brachionus plicatilis TaxID=10195 RepID=A0A3M7SPQ2_BRAPC|nr:WD repeat-containing 63 [Brachionus plicatilis]
MSKPTSRASQKPNSTSRLSNNSAKPRENSAPKLGSKQNTKKNLNQFDEYTIDCPAGLYRLFLSSGTQAAFNLRSDEDITQEDNFRLVPKQNILDDMVSKQAVSDFSPLRKQIEDYPEDEILVVYDYEFQHDKNFFICLSQNLKEIIQNPPLVLPPEPQREPPKYVPPESKPWVSMGSEKQIDEASFKDTRPLVKCDLKVSKVHLFREAKFKDVDDKKDSNVSIQPFESSFDTKMVEIETGVQAAPFLSDSCSQTIWRYPKNATTQYEPRFLDPKECDKVLAQGDLKDFISSSIPELESALQQNVLFNAFENDWELLGDEMSSIGGPGDMHLKEYQSFSDIHNSKNKVVTCVQWHPELKGIVAMSLAENYTLYERLDNVSKTVITPSLILIWSFFDPIQPKLFLEAPDDIYSFAFSNSDPNVIAGGCINGQVVLWDIGPWEERIKNPRGDHRDKDLFIVS